MGRSLGAGGIGLGRAEALKQTDCRMSATKMGGLRKEGCKKGEGG